MAIETRAAPLVLAALLAACASSEVQKPVGRAGFLGAGLCPSDDGVEIRHVHHGSPAAKAGLKDGDVVTSYGGAALSQSENRRRLLWDIRSGEKKLELDVKRGGRRLTVKAAPAVRDVYPNEELYAALSDDIVSGRGVSVAVIVSEIGNARPEFFDSAQALEAWRQGMKASLETNFESLLLDKNLLRCGNYSVADRDKTAQVLKELNFQMTGAVSPETAKQLGKLVGASDLLFVSFSRFQEGESSYLDQTSARLVDVETDRVLASVQFKQKIRR